MEITEETQPDWGKDLVGKTLAAKPDNLESDPQSLCGKSRTDLLCVCVCALVERLISGVLLNCSLSFFLGQCLTESGILPIWLE